MDERKTFADFPRRLNEIDAVIVMFFDARRDRENIRVEDDILRRKADRLRQDFIGTRGNLDFALERIRLALLIERHDQRQRRITVDELGVFDERFLAFLQGDRN